MNVFGIIGQGGTGRPGEGQAAPLGQSVRGLQGVQGVRDAQGVQGAFAALLAGAVDTPALDLGVVPGEAQTAALLPGDAAPTPAAPPPLPPAIRPFETQGPVPTGPRSPEVTVETGPKAPPQSEALSTTEPLATIPAAPGGVSAPAEGIAGEGAQVLPAEGGETGTPAGPAPSAEAAQAPEGTAKVAQNAGETAKAAANATGAAAPGDPSGDQSFAEDPRERSARSGPVSQPSSAGDEQVRPSVTAAESRGGNPAQTPETAKAATGATAPPTTAPISVPAAEPAPVPLGTPGLQGALPTGDAASTGTAPEGAPGRTGAASPQSEILAVRIQKAVQAGQDRISLRLHPAELGRIDVQLEFAEDGRLRAAILAERGEALDLLQRDARLLERALQEAGLKTDSGSFTFDLRDQSAHDKHQSRDVDGASRNDAEGTADLDDDLAAKPGTGSHRGLIDLTV